MNNLKELHETQQAGQRIGYRTAWLELLDTAIQKLGYSGAELPAVIAELERARAELAAIKARTFLEWAESHKGGNAPAIPSEELRRENMYEDRGE